MKKLYLRVLAASGLNHNTQCTWNSNCLAVKLGQIDGSLNRHFSAPATVAQKPWELSGRGENGRMDGIGCGKCRRTFSLFTRIIKYNCFIWVPVPVGSFKVGCFNSEQVNRKPAFYSISFHTYSSSRSSSLRVAAFVYKPKREISFCSSAYIVSLIKQESTSCKKIFVTFFSQSKSKSTRTYSKVWS